MYLEIITKHYSESVNLCVLMHSKTMYLEKPKRLIIWGGGEVVICEITENCFSLPLIN